MADECGTLRTSLGNFLSEKNRKVREAEERAKLLERRTRIGQSPATEQLYKEGQSISNSLNMARDIESSGRSILCKSDGDSFDLTLLKLDSIGSQNEQIKVK